MSDNDKIVVCSESSIYHISTRKLVNYHTHFYFTKKCAKLYHDMKNRPDMAKKDLVNNNQSPASDY